jgi:Right handed beta helix region/PKD domain/Concanavalin A-like lectin/glucanases superfamily
MNSTINVSNATQLLNAMTHATGGEKIVLQSGDYGNLTLTAGRDIFAHFSSAITITSADPGHPAVFAGMNISGLSNVTFDHVKFDYKATTGALGSVAPFKINNCSNVTISNSEFDGDKASGRGPLSDGYGTGHGLTITGGSNIALTNNEIHDFSRGVIVSKVNGVTVSGNDLHGMSSDGLDFAQVTNVTIDSNHIHDFVRSPLSVAHPDMIQFWTAGTTSPSTNIKITNNFLDIGAGDETQSIFMRNEMVDAYHAGQNMFYKNVEISNNIIRNADSHGISVGETNGLKIDNNTLLQSITQDQGGTISIPYITVAKSSTLVTITDNVVPSFGPAITGSHPGWTIGNNVLAGIDDPNSENYIGKLFYDALDKTSASVNDFHIVPGSTLDTSHAGSHLTAPLTSTAYSGYIDAHPTTGKNYTSLSQTFDATHIYDSLGKVALTGAKIVWDFGDGSKGTGLVTNHVYAQQGDYTATATITLANGKTLALDKTLHVQSSSFFDADFNTNAFDHSLIANEVTMNNAKLVFTSDGGHAIDLQGGVVRYKTNGDFFNNKEYSLVVDFKKDVGEENQGGRLVYFSGSYVITLGADGLNVAITTTMGTKTLKADNLGIADSDWHRIALSFSGETGFAKLYLDGHEVASVGGLQGAIQKGSGSADLYLGGPFGGSFGGQIDNLHISDTAFSTAALTTGTLARAHSEFISLTQFDPVAAYVANHGASPQVSMPAPLPHVDTQHMMTLPTLPHHSDFTLF